MSTTASNANEHATSRGRPTIDHVAKAAHEAVDKAADAAAPTAEWLGEQADRLKSTPRTMVDETRGYVSAHPLKSLGVAIAAGFILSRLLR